ncbi:MAG: aspartate aminotransferase family protein [Desulfobacterales bacterium]|nr:aspartate aminotransferase family protein [Desulfobacterales bacterium]
MSNTSQDWIQRADRVLVGNYSRFPATMVQGRGSKLKDADGREYLDFLSGIAVCALGHCHPAVTRAICEQAGELVHVSNLFYTRPQIELAELLVANSFADRVFFANSGAEANEAAIKLARKHSAAARFEIISLAGSFHGRTLATVAATGQPRFHQGFEPMPAGFVHAPFGDLSGLEAMIGPRTCAVLCEPLQGESGVRLLAPDYLKGIRELCDRNGLLLIFDEVQTGIGRTGTLFAHEQLGVVPDILTSAKALANGLPLGAMLTTEKIAASLTPGSHASTFGGNPVAAAAAVATLKIVLGKGFLDEVRATGDYLGEQLAGLARKHRQYATGSRGMGMIRALELTGAGIDQGITLVNRMFDQGFLINFAGNTVLRFVPPLTVGRPEIDTMISALDQTLAALP